MARSRAPAGRAPLDPRLLARAGTRVKPGRGSGRARPAPRGRARAAKRRSRTVALGTLVAILLFAGGAFVSLWRLGTPSWNVDEIQYRSVAADYMDGSYRRNLEHPFLAKQLIGVSTELLGVGPGATRLPSALLTIATGLVLLALGTGLGGLRAGLAAAGVWWLLPRAPGILDAGIGRYAMLEPAMLFFDALALLLAWVWGRTGRWQAAAGAGLAVGLAASCKFAGVLILPAMLLAALWAPRPLRVRGGHVALMGVLAIVGFLGPYLLAGPGWPRMITGAIEFQSVHARDGHDQLVAGRVSPHPPWWSHLWWQLQYLGPAGMAALWAATCAGLIAGLRTRDGRRAAVFAAAALLVPAVVVTISPLRLPHYHLAWSIGQALAAGLGLAALWGAAARRRTAASPGLAWLLGGAVSVALAIVAVTTMHGIATLRPADYLAAVHYLDDRGESRSTMLVWGYGAVMRAYMPEAKVLNDPPRRDAPDVIVVDRFAADRTAGTPMAAYVQARVPGYERRSFGRVTVYVR